MLFGRPAEPPSTPDPEGTIRIGGIRVSIEAAPDNVRVTLHDRRLHHHSLYEVITAQLQKKGYAFEPHLSEAGSGAATPGFQDRPSIINLRVIKPDSTPPLTADAVTSECKEYAIQITDLEALAKAYGDIARQKRAALSKRSHNGNGIA